MGFIGKYKGSRGRTYKEEKDVSYSTQRRSLQAKKNAANMQLYGSQISEGIRLG